MGVRFNHTIIGYRDQRKAAVLLSEILGLSDPSQLGSMLLVQRGGNSAPHAAFLLFEDEFDQVVSQLHARGLPFWRDFDKQQAGEIHGHNGGRGLYLEDSGGQLLEVMTQSCVTETSP